MKNAKYIFPIHLVALLSRLIDPSVGQVTFFIRNVVLPTSQFCIVILVSLQILKNSCEDDILRSADSSRLFHVHQLLKC